MPVVGQASEYLRAKTCPLLASSTASTSPEYERAGAARASRVEFFDSGMPVPAERARAVAAAMRMPVKVPGPTPASTRPTEPRSSPARSRAACMAGSSVSEAPRAVRETSASTSRPFPRARATVVTESRRRGPGSARAQTLCGRSSEADAPRGRGLVVDMDDGRVLDNTECRICPLHKRYGIRFQVVLDLQYVMVFDPLQAIEVHVVDPNPSPVLEPLVAAGELVGRARHPLRYAKRSGRGPHEGGLAGADLAGEHNDVTRTKHPCYPGCQLLEHSFLQAFELHGEPWDSTRAPAGLVPAPRQGSG